MRLPKKMLFVPFFNGVNSTLKKQSGAETPLKLDIVV